MREPKVWLVLDVSYLCWRAFHTTGGMKHGSNPTGVLFGFFRELSTLAQQHATDNFVFCFDSFASKRKELYPDYKGDRQKKEISEEEAIAIAGMRKQVKRLRTKSLAEIGFANVFEQDGYEADDLIASVCQNVKPKDEVVIVSADRDLYQLLRTDRVTQWNPFKKKVYTDTKMYEELKVLPEHWAAVKAIIGKKDNLKGLKGVGEGTATAYIQDSESIRSSEPYTRKVTQKKAVMIHEFMQTKRFKLNLKLATLPFPGVMKCKPVVHIPIDMKSWNIVMKSYGIKSLYGAVPSYYGFKMRRR